MPKLVKMYITHVLIGFAVAAAFLAAILYFNVANLGHLILTSDIGWLAALIFWIANGIVFSGVQFGMAIMRMAEKEGGDQGGKRDGLPVALEPVPLLVEK